MRIIILVISLLLIANTSFANQCIVNTLTNEIKEWTSGVYCVIPPMTSDEELKEFRTIPYRFDKKLIYENGDIRVTDEDLPVIDYDKNKLLELLDDDEVITKLKDKIK